MFFWYFPAENCADNAPFVLWLQGGPGTSCLFSIFHEVGPYNLVSNDTIDLRKYRWNNETNILFVDNPIGTGYSFTDSEYGYTNFEPEIAHNLYIVLTQVFKLFPELSARDLYLSGESYGCKFASALGYEIHRQNNLVTTSEEKMNLKGITIGDGYCDPIHMLDYGDYLYNVGLLGARERELFNNKSAEIIKLIQAGSYAEATRRRDALISGGTISLFNNLTGFVYDLNILKTQDQATPLVNYLAINNVIREAIHVGNTTFSDGSNVLANMVVDRALSVAPLIQSLIEEYPIRFYNGQFDPLDGYTLTLNFLSHLKWSGSEEFETAVRKIWRVDDEIAGYVKTAKNMSEVLVRLAGHLVPANQQQWSYELLVKNFILGQPLNLTSPYISN